MYLKNTIGQVKELHDTDKKTADFLLNTGKWKMVKNRRDTKAFSYSEDIARGIKKSKKATPKAKPKAKRGRPKKK